MSIFLDTGDIKEIKKYKDMGIIRGITSNPTILKRSNIIGNLKDIKKEIIEIGRVSYPYPVSIELTSNEESMMIAQMTDLLDWTEDGYINLNVKIPIHGSDGESNLKLINKWAKAIDINVTAMMSAQQCFLAALAGAKYVSLFGGRVNDMGYSCVEEIKKLRKVLDVMLLSIKDPRESFPEIIVGSVREAANVVEFLIGGADIVTVPPGILEKMIVHPRTKETVREFLDNTKN